MVMGINPKALTLGKQSNVSFITFKDILSETQQSLKTFKLQKSINHKSPE
jgi:hypothetical protein